MTNDLFRVLLTENYYLFHSIFIEQFRDHDSIFQTPSNGREGGNGIIFIFSGEIQYYSQKTLLYKAKEGDIVFLPKQNHYWCRFSKGEKNEKCHFGLLNFEILNHSFLTLTLSDTIVVAKLPNALSIRNKFLDAIKLNKRGVVSPAVIKFKALELLTDIATAVSQQNNPSGIYAVIETGLTYLEHHFTENTPIPKLASMCFISETRFRKIVKQYTGFSPAQYRNNLRCNRAKELLNSGLMSLDEIAGELGFYDIAHFYRVFKKTTGMNPGDYKNGTPGFGDRQFATENQR